MIEPENFVPEAVKQEAVGQEAEKQSDKNKTETNAVCYYSETGETKRIAEYFAKETGYSLTDITDAGADKESVKGKNIFCYDNLVLCFPVHCQNIPGLVKDFLAASKIKNLTVIATYGKMNHGNVLYEVQKNYRKNIKAIVGAAYVPTKHSYITGDEPFGDFCVLKPVAQKIKKPSEVFLPKLKKNPLANFFPKLRSRIGIKIYKNSACSSCGLCENSCNFAAIKNGVVNNKCIRCLKCVKICPESAIGFKPDFFMKKYLKKKKITVTIIYI